MSPIQTTTAPPTTAVPAPETFARTVPFFVERHSWGEHRKASMSNVDIKQMSEAEAEAAKRMLSLRKRLLHSEKTCAIRQHDTRFRERLQDLAAAPFRPGLYLIPLGLMERVDDEAQAWLRTRDRLADEAAEEYPTLIGPMRAALGPLFNEFDYPSRERFRACFWATYRFVNMGVPDVIRSIRAEVFTREREKLEEEGRRAAVMVQQHLRVHLLEITEHLRDLLSPKANGRLPALRDGALDRLFDFLRTVEARDVTNDGALRALVGRMRASLDDTVRGVDDLREDDDLRRRTASVMTDVHRALEGMVTDGPVRAMRLRAVDELEVV